MMNAHATDEALVHIVESRLRERVVIDGGYNRDAALNYECRDSCQYHF